MKPYYQDKYVTIYLGDCREILPSLPKVDLVLTDPPYNIGKADWDIRPDGWLEAIEKIAGGAIYWFGMPDDIPQDGYRTLIYAKTIPLPRHPMNSANDWIYSYQPIFYRKGDVWNKPIDKKASDVLWFHPEVGIETFYHPTQKPLKLCKHLIAISSNGGAVVIDPFMGSGTTLKAAKDLNRKCIGIEIEEKYCEIAANRCRQEVMELS